MKTCSCVLLFAYALSPGLTARAGAQSPSAGAPTAQSPASAPADVGMPARGPANAPVTITEFCDFESEGCGRMAVVLRGLVDAYPDQVRLMFRHLATETQVQSPRAYSAVLAAAQQGRPWDMWDMVFANQDRLSEEGLRSMALQLGLDGNQFILAFQSGNADAAVAGDAEEAASLSITAGPAIVVGGRKLKDVTTLTQLKAFVDAELKSPQ
jgi:protein-disulfide isomerase